MESGSGSASSVFGKSSSGASGQKIAAALAKAKSVVLKPEEMWPLLKAEAGDERSLVKEFILIMAAIGPVCQILGALLFGIASVGTALYSGLIAYMTQLGLIAMLMLALPKLVEIFGGAATRLDCLRLIAYSLSASFLVGFLGIIPWIPVIFIAAILSLYSIYLFYSGVPTMTGVPQERRFGFLAVAFVCLLVIGAVVSSISSWFLPG
jgi:hypothetical protein